MQISKVVKLFGSMLIASAVVACGGGGGSAGTTPGTGGGTTTPSQAASIEIFSSSTQLSSATGSSATFTVLVKDANNQALPAQTVSFTASSGNLSGALPTPSTGAAGEPVTGVSLSAGNDQSNRDIVVTARSGAVTKTITVAVQGTSITLAGDSAVLAGGNTTFTAKVLDSSGRAVSGAALTVVSALGNRVAPASVVTDSQGAAQFSYTGTNGGADSLTVSGLGTSAKASVSVSNDDFRFESPSAGASIVVGGTSTVTVRFLSAGVPLANRPVTFSSTRGSILATSATTDVNGRASTVITSLTSGPATIIAQVASAQAVQLVTFVALVPDTIVLQANPGTVLPNAGGSTVNQSALQALVRDVSGNPVPNQVVNFNAITDASNGTVSPASGVTDANGSVVAQFIPGALTTPSNGVQIRATVQGTGISGNALLTVSGQALFISIGANNEISNLNPTTYQKEFSVYVTDATGAPAAGRVVNLAVFPDAYGKGTLAWNGKVWTYAGAPVFCANEDDNPSLAGSTRRNGVLDAGEDVNGNGRLTPGLPVVVAPASVTTSSTGFATFNLQYGENFAFWVATTITARTSVSGTESLQTAQFTLAPEVGDVSNETVPPSSARSPFGTGAACTDPN